ncbi:hypothetical protein Prum_069140 [Phytohabitans rumicis]|uniref:Uncharacterized protein n=1 Tax=Phytohabitans rumicis TaxID=1076125 RepID=A0A6V8L7N8_9ACTN|nr:hypothetical protein Prum_069140 [Phytohabitans rumicis]
MLAPQPVGGWAGRWQDPLITAGHDQPAREPLLALAGTIRASTIDQQQAGFEYAHALQWAAADGVAQVTRRSLWRAPDDSGLLVELVGPAAAQLTAEADHSLQKVTSRFAAGGMFTVVAGDLSTDPERLCAQLDATDGGHAAQRLHAVGSLAFWHPHLLASIDVRQALLTCLARSGLLFRGAATDRAGRAAVAVTAQHQSSRMTALFDPRTGHVLAFEDVALPGADPTDRAASVASYLLIIEQGRRTRTPDL